MTRSNPKAHHSSTIASSVERLSIYSDIPAEGETTRRSHPQTYRMSSPTPSSTSHSEDEEQAGYSKIDYSPTESEHIRRWARKGKGKDVDDGRVSGGLAGSLPLEVLIQIFKALPSGTDLLSSLLVCRSWCLAAFGLLWNKPILANAKQLASLTRILISPTTLPYATSIRRLHLATISVHLNDHLLQGLENCSRVEKLTVTHAENLSTQALKSMVSGMTELLAADFTSTPAVENQVVAAVAMTSDKLQGLSLNMCKGVGDEGIKAIARYRKVFRRLKVGHCHRLTDKSIVAFAQSCVGVLEMDLAQVPQLTNASLYAIFLHMSHLRELRMNGNSNIDSDGVPLLSQFAEEIDDESDLATDKIPWYAQTKGMRTIPLSPSLEHLRTVDFTSCTTLNDLAIEHLVLNAPRIRTLTLAKCATLTDTAIDSIGKLGRYLHYLHLGHVNLITDTAITNLARACTRIRYIDVACCPLLTDLSVFELAANLPKLRRIGLVKVTNLTDDGIYALIERHATLERIHLSYCDNLSVKAITFLLNRLLRLTHLSLTGVSAFKSPKLQQFCRPTPAEFNDHQRESFCVYSNHGITSLRNHLNSQQMILTTSDDGSRRGSESSASSMTVPGGYSPPLRFGGRQLRRDHDANPRMETPNDARQRASPQSDDQRHVPTFRYASQRNINPRTTDIAAPGLPTSFLTSSAPNFWNMEARRVSRDHTGQRNERNAGPVNNTLSNARGPPHDSNTATARRRQENRAYGNSEMAASTIWPSSEQPPTDDGSDRTMRRVSNVTTSAHPRVGSSTSTTQPSTRHSSRLTRATGLNGSPSGPFYNQDLGSDGSWSL